MTPEGTAKFWDERNLADCSNPIVRARVEFRGSLEGILSIKISMRSPRRSSQPAARLFPSAEDPDETLGSFRKRHAFLGGPLSLLPIRVHMWPPPYRIKLASGS